ncbi:hypothetical protein L665_03104 [Ralstonia solanacearum SD54]|nr:hypothetical protein F504_1292 [Ralstonia pseudosolanacearum FQY_4]ANH33403.1 hypothetical protein A3768_2256 [Ralstonia solanacearum]ESS47544.1 hypothetical protein L665_03104 [Ralstonia solanacearum SD54]
MASRRAFAGPRRARLYPAGRAFFMTAACYVALRRKEIGDSLQGRPAQHR